MAKKENRRRWFWKGKKIDYHKRHGVCNLIGNFKQVTRYIDKVTDIL